MLARILLVAIAFLIPACVAAQEDTGSAPDVEAIHHLIERHVFRNVMGSMFSARDLKTHGVAVHVNGKAAWSEFHWVFRATMRKDGSAVTRLGIETQVKR